MTRPVRRQRGFTLLEVLVALAILAVALVATVKGIGQHVNGLAYLKEKTLAHWVAMNQVAELHLSGEWPSSGEKKGTAMMAGQEWSWKIKISATEDAETRRLDVSVSQVDSEQVLAKYIAYMGKPW